MTDLERWERWGDVLLAMCLGIALGIVGGFTLIIAFG